MSSIAVVTVVTRNYIHFARALAISVKEYAPGVPVLVCVADDPGPDFQPPAEWDGFVLGKDLGIHQWRRFAFQYTPFELACALKPHVVEHFLQRGHERIAYLDGDMQIYSNLSELRGWLDDATIVLTPHARWSKTDPNCSFENTFLRTGVYNAGFFAVRDSLECRRFLSWWQAKMAKFGIDDVHGGLFTDQKWLDMVPGMFGGVHIAKHCGYNVGHWMLAYSPAVEKRDGDVYIAGDRLAIFHYSGFNPQTPHLISRYERSTVADYPPLAPLCAAYANRLIDCADPQLEKMGCEFSKLTDGTAIDPLWRELVRSNHAQVADIADPFDATATPQLAEKYRKLAPYMVARRIGWRLEDARHPGALTHKSSLRSVGKKLEKLLRSTRDRARAFLAKRKIPPTAPMPTSTHKKAA